MSDSVQSDMTEIDQTRADEPSPGTLPREEITTANTRAMLEDEEEALSVDQNHEGDGDVFDIGKAKDIRGGDRTTLHGGIVIQVGAGPQPSKEPQPAQEEVFKDPTVLLDHLSAPTVDLEPELVESSFSVLSKENVLVLSCFDPDILSSAGYLVAKKFQCERRFLGFQDESGEGLDVEILFSDEHSWATPSLVLVEAMGRGAQSFVDSVVRTKRLEVQNRLKQCSVYLLLLVIPDLLPEEGTLSSFLPLYTVPFLEPRLRQRFPDKAEQWAQDIRNQRKAGLWPRGEKRFWERFAGLLKRNALEQAIERQGRALREGRYAPDRDGYGPMLKPGAELENTALFLAAFFLDLPVEDFQHLLLRLVGDRVREIRKTTFVLTVEGEGLPCESTELRKLADDWREDYPAICQRCQLEFLPSVANPSGGSSLSLSFRGPTVAFEMSDLGEHVRTELMTLHYPMLVRFFARVHETGLLFDPGAAVLEGTLRLLQEMATLDPHRYGSKVLLELGTDLTSSSSHSPRPIEHRMLLNRLYHLIRAFLKEPTLQGVVEQFFTELIDRRRHEDALELVKRLRFATGFDQVYWWKQLLNRGSEEAKRLTYDEMLAVLRSSGGQMQETLLAIGKWLPKPGQTTRSASVAAANQLLFDLLRGVTEESPPLQTSAASLRNAVSSALLQTPPELESFTVLRWLFHSSFLDFLRSEDASRLARSWMIPPGVKRLLAAEAARIDGVFKERFERNLLLQAAERAAPPLLFQAVILADLAFSLQTGKTAGAASADQQLLAIAPEIARICNRGQNSLALESWWGEMGHILLEILTAVRPPGGVEDEAYRSVSVHLREQSEAVARIKGQFQRFRDTKHDDTGGELR